MPRFDFQRCFLTYSQCNISANVLADFLFTFGPVWLEVAAETHADGAQHLHAVVVWGERYRGRTDTLDIQGFHPNIEAVRHHQKDIYRVRHYIRKEEKEHHLAATHRHRACDYTGEPIARGIPPPYVEKTERLDFGGILAVATTSAEFLDLVREHQPKEFVLRNDAICSFARDYFTRPAEYIPPYPRESYVVPPELDQWVEEVFSEVSTPSPGYFFLIVLVVDYLF